MDDSINIEKTYNHWIDTSDKDFNTMIHLFDSKDYHWALFIGHIVIERLMKACIVLKTGLHAPLTHDLTNLANLSGLQFTEEYLDWLDTITTFNINARYDSYKEAFYKKCTIDFTTDWIKKIKILQLWIKQKL